MWLSAAEALNRLQVKPQTLYANVSRGRIRAKPDPAEARRSLYHAKDVERLAERHAGRRKAEVVATQAIAFGEPVLASSLSTIAEGKLWYCGHDAALLAERATLEQVAALFWGAGPISFTRHACVLPQTGRHDPPAPLLQAFAALAARAGLDPPSRGRSPAILRLEAAEIMATLADALLGPLAGVLDQPLHERVAEAWNRPLATDLIRRALVLLADHELNASTFATRVAASTGASLAASVLAGLATLTGPLHGGASARAQALCTRAAATGPEEAVRAALELGQSVPAFGHALYAGQDARASALMKGFELPSGFAALMATARRIVGEEPNIDFALAAFAVAHELPEDAPLVLFALARCVGWLAHALEQVEKGQLIRPRARYVEPAVGTE